MDEKWCNMVKDDVVRWIREYIAANGTDETKVVIGLSGGKDSSVCAALCVEALGADRVIGIRLPDVESCHAEEDLDDAQRVANALGIKVITHAIDPGSEYRELYLQTGENVGETVKTNLPARMRMAILYMYANHFGARVCNTCNKSETYVGYDTRWGDQCGDFSPIQYFTAREVRQIGRTLNLPTDLVERPSDDGMCGLTDEERWGFTYETLDDYIDGKDVNQEDAQKIEQMHRRAMYKITSIELPSYSYHKNNSRYLRKLQ